MYKIVWLLLSIMALQSARVCAAELRDLIGRWTWDKFVIEVTECKPGVVCAKVIVGPKNVGMEVFGASLTPRGGELFGKIQDPNTGREYFTRFRQVTADRWVLDGCTVARVCLSGEFVRMK